MNLDVKNIRSKMSQGFALQQQGKLAEAETIFRQVIAIDPTNADALAFLGITLAKVGKGLEALHFLAAAVQYQPANPAYHSNLGNALRDVGRYAEAVECYDRALKLKPDFFVAHHARGVSLLFVNKPAQAIESLERAVQMVPNDAYALNDLGVGFERVGRFNEALMCFSRSATLEPKYFEAHHNLGKVLLQLGNAVAALASFDQAVKLAPRVFELHLRRGIALAVLERYQESLVCFDTAVALNHNSVEAHNNRGMAFGRIMQPEKALESFLQAAALQPDSAQIHANVATALKNLRRYRESLSSFDRALSYGPDDFAVQWGKALVLLSLGEFADGWRLYESRLGVPDLLLMQRQFDRPRWSGGDDLHGKTVLIHAEQGLGDTLQFCRYIPMLEDQGATVVFQVQPVLKKILRSLRFSGTLMSVDEPLPKYDCYSPLLSLPLAFGTVTDSIPSAVPYLNADEGVKQYWRERFSNVAGLKVGINWQGNIDAEKQISLRGRSFALIEAQPLAQIPGVQLMSLQKGSAANQLDRVDFGARILRVIDPHKIGEDDFAETAAILMALDLLITADTALAHLAGALGIRVWVVLPMICDWRWCTEGNLSPWYPTMRLFRQTRNGYWPDVFEHVAQLISIRKPL